MLIIKKIYKKIAFYVGTCVIFIYKLHIRHKNKNKDFTILCSNCIGGIIYNRLGLKMLSPTINMWETQGDFIKFASDPKYYIEQPLYFIETEWPFPVAECGDIKLYFNHARTNVEAENNWNRRKTRINYDNIYIIMYYKEKYTIEQIREIEKAPCKKRIVLTNQPIPLEYAYYIEEDKHGRDDSESFLDIDDFGFRTFEKKWDYVSWLN